MSKNKINTIEIVIYHFNRLYELLRGNILTGNNLLYKFMAQGKNDIK